MKPILSRLIALALAAALLPTLRVGGEEIVIPFNQPSDLEGWKSDYEIWHIEGNVLTPAPPVSSSRRSLFWRTISAYSDLDISIECMALEEGIAGAGFGVMYRAKSENEFYSVLFDPRPERQSASLIKTTPERDSAVLASARSLKLKPGSWHTVRIIARGAEHAVHLDGVEILTATDSTFSEGVIGLRVNFAQTHFRNLKINGSQAPLTARFDPHALPFVTIAADATPGHYEGFPSLCTTKGGDLLCVFYAGYKHVPSTPNELLPKGGQIAAVRSTDGGKTWSKPVTIYDSPIDDHDPEVTRLSDGRIAVTICRWPVRGTHKPFIIWSSDDGVTWTDAQELDQPIAATEVPQGPIVELPDGKLLMPTYGTVASGEPSAAIVRSSSDGGKTWSWTPQQVLRSAYTDKQDMNVYEPCIVHLPGSRLLAIARQKMFRWESTDGGTTWSTLPDMPFRGDSPNLLLTSKNILLCGIRFRGMSEPLGKNRGTCVAYSSDFGKTWSDPVLVAPVIGGYTYMSELPDGRVFIVYYTEGNGFSDIRGVWLKVDESGIQVLPAE